MMETLTKEQPTISFTQKILHVISFTKRRGIDAIGANIMGVGAL
jgi:hypothetical protein